MEDKKYYFLDDIAHDYNMSMRTLRRWIKPIYNELLSMYPIPRKRLSRLTERQKEKIEKYLEGYYRPRIRK